MSRVHITGWREGLDKVQMTKVIRGHTGLNLAAAKRCTDSVLAGESVTLEVPTQADAMKLVDELTALGAVADSAE